MVATATTNGIQNDWIVTVRNAAVVVVVLTLLHRSSSFNAWLAAEYHRWHAVINHRLFEGVVAVATFATAGFAFSLVEAAGLAGTLRTRRLSPLVVEQDAVTTDRLSASREVLIASSLHSGASPIVILVETLRKHSRNVAQFLPSSATKEFAFWLVVNIVLYLGLIDVSQRLLGDSLDSLHFAPDEPPSIWRMSVEVCFSICAYDFLFWWIHRAWHQHSRPPSLYPGVGKDTDVGQDVVSLLWHLPSRLFDTLVTPLGRFHARHHDYYQHTDAPLHVMNTFHHHFLDALAQVGINIIVQQIPLAFLFPGPRHKLSKAVHNVLVTYLLVEAHSGLDAPFMSHRLFPAVFGGSVRHQVHHQLGVVYFHQFFKYLDDWFYSSKDTKSK